MNRDPVKYLAGRIHLDYENSFMLHESGIDGLIELCRMSATPPERTSRASIGTVLTGVEYIVSMQTVPPTLIPPNKPQGEQFKASDILLIADSGGLIYPAIPGVYDKVWAIDFTSLYPFIMANHNIGNESILCPHEECKGKNLVPEVDYHTCHRRVGVVPRTMKLVLEKRVKLKLAKSLPVAERDRERYAGVDSAMKWILVCCLEGSTRVLIRKNGRVLTDRIDTVVNEFTEKDTLEALGIDEFGQPEFKPVKNVIKTRPKTPVYQIEFRGGKKITATGDHLWPVMTKNGWKNVRTDQLTNDDWIPQLDKYDQEMVHMEVDLIDELSNRLTSQEKQSWRVKSNGLIDILSDRFKQLKQEATSDYSIQSVHSWRNKGMLPLKYWPLVKDDTIDGPIFIGSGKISGGLVQWLNAKIPLSINLGYFLGFLLGDGSIGNTVRLDVGSEDTDLIEELCRIILELWNIEPKVYEEKTAEMVVIQINSRAICKILRQVFGIIGSARKGKLSVPEVIWNGPDEIVEGFLSGLFAADGSIGTDRLFACFNTSQESFAIEIGMLCSRVGLQYRIYGENSEMNKVELRDDRAVRSLESFGFMCSKHKQRIERHRENRKLDRFSEWPTEASGIVDLARKVRKTRNPRVTQRCSISKDVFLEKIKQTKEVPDKLNQQEMQHLENLEKLGNAPISFTRVVSVSQLEVPPEYVYCFELDSPTPWFMIEGSLITHNCFGYLGFKNSRWGSIESHQCVTAYARRYLNQAMRIAMEHGYELLCGITDSLFIRKIDQSTDDNVDALVYQISKETAIPMDTEGRFQWVVFCNVKEFTDVGALNRYFGYFETGDFKLRGIRTRQRRVTQMEREFQKEALELLAQARSVKEFESLIPKTYHLLRVWQQRLRVFSVDARDLVIKIKSHVGVGNYKSRTQQALVAESYHVQGRKIEPGQSMFYLVRNDKSRTLSRITIGPNVKKDSRYDVQWYCNLLEDALLELVEAPQRQFYGEIKYTSDGFLNKLDEWDEPKMEIEDTIRIRNDSIKSTPLPELDEFFEMV
jgi:DNA polymerase elongation subunit (family B)